MDTLPAQPDTHTPETSNSSIFHDRHEPYFVDWVLRQGLSVDAPDQLVIPQMQSYIAETGRPSIQPKPELEGPKPKVVGGRPYIS